jgi:hypothetical protein
MMNDCIPNCSLINAGKKFNDILEFEWEQKISVKSCFYMLSIQVVII